MRQLEERKPTFNVSAEAERIIKLLERCEIGDKITYETIIETVGGNARDGILPFYRAVRTARRYIEREHNVVFDVIFGVGLIRLSNHEIVPSVKHRVGIERRRIKRVAQTLACADLDKLSKSERLEALALQAQLGAMRLTASIRTTNLLERKIREGAALEVGNVLKLFRGAARQPVASQYEI